MQLPIPEAHDLEACKFVSIKNTIILFDCPSNILYKNCFQFSWDHCKCQEKIKTMLMPNFGGTNKEYYGIFDTG